MFKENGDQSWKCCPKCKKQGRHICGYGEDVWGNPMALDRCEKCGHISEWDEEGKEEQDEARS